MGSKPRAAGVTRALRFCVMESSRVLRDSRRNSASESTYQQLDGAGGTGQSCKCAPRNVVVERQNWGVSLGFAGGCSPIVTSRGGGREGKGPGSLETCGSELCRLDQRK